MVLGGALGWRYHGSTPVPLVSSTIVGVDRGCVAMVTSLLWVVSATATVLRHLPPSSSVPMSLNEAK